MKYNIILLFLITSCINPTYVGKGNFLYSTKGFAMIENESYSNLDNNIFVFHNKLKSGTKIKLSNPVNNKSVAYVVKKKVEYNDFYKVLISVNIAEELGLDFDFPYLEINEIKNNKSFIAKKAITESVEKKIANKAPIAKINIDNLTKFKKVKKTKLKNYSILVAEFYSLKSAEILKEKLSSILLSSNYQLIYITKKNDKSYKLLMGPYNTINKLKNDYIVLNDSNFEDLNIIIND
jgi:hypothetical protein